NVTLAALSAVVAVQSFYYNAILIFAICMGGFVVSAHARRWNLFRSLLLIGGISALSLLPYLPVFQRSKSWTPMFQYPELWRGLGLSWFCSNLGQTLNAAAPWGVWIWISLLLVAFAFAVYRLFGKGGPGSELTRADLAVFSLTGLVVGIVGYYLFLRRLQY